ncbi:MAG: hypothetical protein IRY94_12795 [Rhodospirillaceae bacterium]|nr:hypothetical protein [Rhodospirillaceae bacterium]
MSSTETIDLAGRTDDRQSTARRERLRLAAAASRLRNQALDASRDALAILHELAHSPPPLARTQAIAARTAREAARRAGAVEAETARLLGGRGPAPAPIRR